MHLLYYWAGCPCTICMHMTRLSSSLNLIILPYQYIVCYHQVLFYTRSDRFFFLFVQHTRDNMVGFGPQSGTLSLTVIEGKDLPAADRNGFSDPFVTISVNNKLLEDVKSERIKRTLNPVWNWSQDIALEDCTQVSITVWDWDRLGKNDKLGMIALTCPLKKLVDQDIWETLNTGKGQLHVKYRFIPEDFEGNSLDPTAEAVLAAIKKGVEGQEGGDDEELELGGAGLLSGTAQTRIVDGRPVNVARPHAPLFADKKDIVLNPAVLGIRRLLKPAIFNMISLFFSYWLGKHGYGAVYGFFMVVMAFSLEEIWSVRAVKMVAKDFEKDFDEEHYPDDETAEWLNAILDRVWHNFPRVAEKMVSDIIAPQLDANKEMLALSKLELEDFDFGTRAPNLTDLRVVHDEPNEFIFDFDFDWDWDFEVKIRATKGVTMPLAVKDFMLHSKFRVFIHLTPDRAPYCSFAWVQMIQKPKLDVSVVPLVEITAIPGLDALIKSTILGIITNLMVLPNRLELDLAEIMQVEVPLEDMLNPEAHRAKLESEMEFSKTGKSVAVKSPKPKNKK
ncbi:hypothetical protein SARC_05775 [Sphaeroforma arctica JP610]|uniref:C2 domain-containing protein n=1 Tax=Sphaeroforma arctica JP610 TaxID=667725 RepID=A0A0L0FZ61_9EUKA|nr:hypothetical protein SARC_05775 [Sphaeroforma arctica JP610]KNC81924.1 hypothetical protein SARC_05775 [Sphaeroforma arctica JP610]|eukprot:XP_014155826.1 hypothetical protein SARC_05775 [Sphaeroforma arctica JP610]